jgi:hypothetical protein
MTIKICSKTFAATDDLPPLTDLELDRVAGGFQVSRVVDKSSPRLSVSGESNAPKGVKASGVVFAG